MKASASISIDGLSAANATQSCVPLTNTAAATGSGQANCSSTVRSLVASASMASAAAATLPSCPRAAGALSVATKPGGAGVAERAGRCLGTTPGASDGSRRAAASSVAVSGVAVFDVAVLDVAVLNVAVLDVAVFDARRSAAAAAGSDRFATLMSSTCRSGSTNRSRTLLPGSRVKNSSLAAAATAPTPGTRASRSRSFAVNRPGSRTISRPLSRVSARLSASTGSSTTRRNPSCRPRRRPSNGASLAVSPIRKARSSRTTASTTTPGAGRRRRIRPPASSVALSRSGARSATTVESSLGNGSLAATSKSAPAEVVVSSTGVGQSIANRPKPALAAASSVAAAPTEAARVSQATTSDPATRLTARAPRRQPPVPP